MPPDIPSLDRYAPAGRQVRGALRLTLRTIGEARFDDLQGLDRLPIYLAGDERVASHLFELIHAGAVASVTGIPNRFGDAAQSFGVVTHQAVAYHRLAARRQVVRLHPHAARS